LACSVLARPDKTVFTAETTRLAPETTLVLVKPDAIRRSLAGEILRRFESRGLELRAAKLLRVDRELAERHYDVHRDKPFFGELVEFITSGKTLALVLEGEGAIAVCRKTIGATNPAEADPGSIRGDLSLSMPDNLVHGSDSPETAASEIALWFGADDLA
jgi:nucleoside-diphosphate kinase